MSSQCPSCCSPCKLCGQTPGPSLSDASPFALCKLLPAGTISLSLVPEASHLFCDHVHAEDGLHTFRGSVMAGHLANIDDDGFCRELDFLIKNHFISATYHCSQSIGVFIRIYVIPYDLGNVQGKLRVRKEAVLGPARRYMRALLPKIVQDRSNWEGNAPYTYTTPCVSVQRDSRSLAEIYGDLASPSPQVIPGGEAESVVSRLLNLEDGLEGFGMRSNLYNYQRRSVAAMLQKEMDLRDRPDPLYIPLNSMIGEMFYLQPGTTEILRECPMVAPSRGGVLCEELGTGKTVMALALILATVNQLSTPEPSIVDDRPVLTPVALRHFPSSTYTGPRKRLSRGKQQPAVPIPPRVPSLVELLLHRRRTSPDNCIPDITTPSGMRRYAKKLDEAEHIDRLPVGDLLNATTPFYHHYQGEPTNNQRTQRKQVELGPRTMYLTSATLVVVPANLISQWDREIQKHCEYSLRVLILRSTSAMPSVRSLASDYDIILMTYPRFTAEYAHKDTTKLHCWKLCTCPEFPGSRVPDCSCETTGVSPLLQIRWKRLMIDEGHVSATLTTSLTPFVKLLSVERRWIITGTPTTNLLGLSFGAKTTEEVSTDDLELEEEPSMSVSEDSAEDMASDDIPSGPSSRSTSVMPASKLPRMRIWNKYDREDLFKLGNMITHFVAVPQFTADSRLVNTHITDPLLDNQGPRPGAIQVLNQVMEMIMIRHRIEDVEQDIVLPPVTQESVLLDLDPYVAKSYNALQATIAINAVDSERTDQDYMFHPRNAEYLLQTVRNMSQLMFWSVDDGYYNAVSLLGSGGSNITTAIARNTSEEDLQLLRDSLRHIQLAYEDPLWRAMQTHEDVPYRISNMDPQVFHTWTRTPHSVMESNDSVTHFMHPDRLLKLRDLVVSRPLISIDRIVEHGLEVVEVDRKLRYLYDEAEKRNSRKQDRRRGKTHHDDNHAILKVTSAAKKASAPEMLNEMRKELNASMSRLKAIENDEPIPSSSEAQNAQLAPAMPALVSASPLAHVRIESSASTKLNYIIKEVLQHSATEKFLIFSDSGLSLAHIAEALELVNVKFLRFTTQIKSQVREQLVLTFETSETYRVFLMELKHGARGLNLVSASRVIFCEPVWQADVESQAIKRAHRIGQTRPISVKTLAIRGTAEENMVARRSALRNSQDKLPKLIEEAGMRHFIANPKFLEYDHVRPLELKMPLFNLPETAPAEKETYSMHVPMHVEASTSKRLRFDGLLDDHEEVLMESPQKKIKGLRFDGLLDDSEEVIMESPQKKKKGVRFD